MTLNEQDCINAAVLPSNFDAFGKGSPLANRDYVFTSESVSEGHPDKICDRISDAIVDTYLAAEPEARCGVETLVTTNRVVLAGEVRGPAAIGYCWPSCASAFFRLHFGCVEGFPEAQLLVTC